MTTKKSENQAIIASQESPVYETIWTMSADDVEAVSRAEQWTTFAFEVSGSNHTVAWLCQVPLQVISLRLDEVYGMYVCMEKDLAHDGTIPKVVSTYPVELGNAYLWNGNELLPDEVSTCDRESVKLTNANEQAWTFGLTKLCPMTNQQQPICADVFLPGQPAEYTPQHTIFAKVGWQDRVRSIIKDLGSGAWARFELTSLDSSFCFNSHSTKWSI